MSYANSFKLDLIDDDVYEDFYVVLNLRIKNNFSTFPTLDCFLNIDKINELEGNELEKLALVNEITPKWILKGHSCNDLILKQNKNKIEFKKGILENPIFKDQSYLDFRNLICDIYEYVAKKNKINHLNLNDMENVDLDDFIVASREFITKKDKYLDEFLKNRKEKIISNDLEII